MPDKHITRIDKWLWAVRIFKTRAQSSEACSGGKVKINNLSIKPSKKIQSGEIVSVRKGIVNYSYQILKIADKRMSAKLISNYLKDLTSQEETSKLTSVKKQPLRTRDKGQGRPTKKERRILDKYRDGLEN